MRIDGSRHSELARTLHWRVTALAADFERLDVWRFPVRIDSDVPLHDFLYFMAGLQRDLIANHGVAGALFRLRQRLGRFFRWDADPSDAPEPRPIPGCVERSIRERLTPADLASTEPAEAAAQRRALPGLGFEPVYRGDAECLLEISNATVHALLHLAREPLADAEWAPLLAVYVKPRGRLGRAYMALIGPFRHVVVYPALMRAAARDWPAYRAAGARSAPPPGSAPDP